MLCPTCGAQAGLNENSCQKCGTTLRAPHVPVIRPALTPSIRYSPPAGLVRHAVVLAAGALLPVVVKGVARLVAQSLVARRPLAGRRGAERIPGLSGSGPLQIETHAIMELRTIRNIRIER